MKPRSICYQCSKLHRRCDQKKPKCGRCIRMGKSCTYTASLGCADEDPQRDDYSNSTSYIDVNGLESYHYNLLRHKQTGKVMTIDEAIKIIQTQNNIPQSGTAMKSILLSSALNRIGIFEFIRGCQFQSRLNNTINKNDFCIYKFRKKDLLEMTR